MDRLSGYGYYTGIKTTKNGMNKTEATKTGITCAKTKFANYHLH